MSVAYYALIAIIVLVALWNLIVNIRGYLRVQRQRKEFHAWVRGVYESHGLASEIPDWAKDIDESLKRGDLSI